MQINKNHAKEETKYHIKGCALQQKDISTHEYECISYEPWLGYMSL